MVDIEHYHIDQDTEFAIEDILTIAKNNGYDGNFATAMFNEDEFLPGGNVVEFLGRIEDICADVLGKTKSLREKRRILFDLNKVTNFKREQDEAFAATGNFLTFPTSQFGVLSHHFSK